MSMKKTPRHRPLSIRVTNALGGVATSAHVVDRDLDADRLMALACRRTGLEDFGPDDFVEPLHLLVRCYNSEAQLNFIGRMSARTYLLQLLENRLKVERDRRRYPEIADQQIESPVFIIGLPRTGSTLLFELMHQNPGLRAPLSWEVMLASPPPTAATFHSDPRIAKVQRMLDLVDRIAPDFKHIHEVGRCVLRHVSPSWHRRFEVCSFTPPTTFQPIKHG